MEIFVVIKNIPLFNHFKGKVIQNVIYFCIWILYKRTAKTFFSLQGITLSLKLSLREDPFNLFCCSYFSLQWTVALLLQQKNVSLHFHFTSVSFSDHKQWWDYLKGNFFFSRISWYLRRCCRKQWQLMQKTQKLSILFFWVFLCVWK